MKTTYELSEPQAKTALADDQGDAECLSFHDISRKESMVPGLPTLEREEVLLLLVQRIAELPVATKKILALYYHENFPLSEIAACFNLSERQTREILSQTVGLLRQSFLGCVDPDFCA